MYIEMYVIPQDDIIYSNIYLSRPRTTTYYYNIRRARIREDKKKKN